MIVNLITVLVLARLTPPITTFGSGTLVINTLISKDEDNASISQHIGWVIAIFDITSLLLMSGGMTAIQYICII
ncbi:BCCT family transporter [Vibrio sp. CB1-14]|uniref:BCCT family transporter n=1 Tax=Vibrio chaetopteri TaxID=3016528 RepID=A0AAU8BKL6_9VIBR